MRAFTTAHPGKNSDEKSSCNGAHKINVPHIDRTIHAACGAFGDFVTQGAFRQLVRRSKMMDVLEKT